MTTRRPAAIVFVFLLFVLGGADVASAQAVRIVDRAQDLSDMNLTAGAGYVKWDPTTGTFVTQSGVSNPDCAAFLATPTSANLRACLSDESGTGAALFAGGNIGAATGTSLAAPIILTTGQTIGLASNTLLTFNAADVLNATALAHTRAPVTQTSGTSTGLSMTGSAAPTATSTLVYRSFF